MTVRKSIYGAIICATALAVTPAFAMGGFHIGGGFAGAAGKIGSKAGSAVHGLSAFHAGADISGKGSEAISAGTPKLATTPDAADLTPKAVHEKVPTTGVTDDGISVKNGGVRVGEYASAKGTVHKLATRSATKKLKVAATKAGGAAKTVKPAAARLKMTVQKTTAQVNSRIHRVRDKS